jgi:hypothetical protein
LEKYKSHWKEIVAGLVGVIIALAFYLKSNDAALSSALGILLAAFSVQAALIKSNVEEALESNLELYKIQTSINDPIFKIRAKKLTEDCLRELKSLSYGTYEVHGSEDAYLELMKFYKTAQTNDLIKSVVIYADNMLLDGLYLKGHREAINRGAIIIKIFIINSEIESPPGIVKMKPWIEISDKIKLFDEAGVKTFIVPLKTIGSDSRLYADFFLYKNIVGISSQGNKGMLSSLKITAEHQDFDDYTHKFEELSQIAYPFSEEIINSEHLT